MARIKLSLLLTDIRGKLSGSVFQGSRSGLVLKSISVKPSKSSNLKSRSLGIAQSVHNSWRNLTAFQKDVWVSFANYSMVVQKNNKSLSLNANELFFKLNFQRLLYGHAILITPEFSKCQFLNYSAELSLSGSNLIFTTSKIMQPASEFIILKITPPLLPSVNSARSRMRNLIFATSLSDTFDISAFYLSLFKRMPVSGNSLTFSYTNADLLSGLLNSFATQKVVL